jgi:hypothetical protein
MPSRKLQVWESAYQKMRRIAEERQQQTQQELEALKAQIAARKQKNETVPDTHDYRDLDKFQAQTKPKAAMFAKNTSRF